MNINELSPTPTEKVPFNLADLKYVPKTSGCYVLTTYDNRILYIGMATNLHQRNRQHLDTLEKTKATPDGVAVWFYYHTYTKTNLEQLERTWINQFLNLHGKYPILNKVNSPVR